MSAVVRPATRDDADAIAEVHVASWRWAYEGQLPDDVLARLTVQDRSAMWRSVLDEDPSDRIFVADLDGRVVGFVSTGAPQGDAEPGSGELHAIYLVREVVGTGVGRLLLARAQQALRDAGYERAFLWVLASNERARRFYENAGWTWDGTTSDHMIECANHPIVRYETSP